MQTVTAYHAGRQIAAKTQAFACMQVDMPECMEECKILQYVIIQVTAIERSKDDTWAVKAQKKMYGDTPHESVSYEGFNALVLADAMLTKQGTTLSVRMPQQTSRISGGTEVCL